RPIRDAAGATERVLRLRRPTGDLERQRELLEDTRLVVRVGSEARRIFEELYGCRICADGLRFRGALAGVEEPVHLVAGGGKVVRQHRRPGSVRTKRFQDLGNAEMKPPPPGRRDVTLDRLPRQRVPELIDLRPGRGAPEELR